MSTHRIYSVEEIRAERLRRMKEYPDRQDKKNIGDFDLETAKLWATLSIIDDKGPALDFRANQGWRDRLKEIPEAMILALRVEYAFKAFPVTEAALIAMAALGKNPGRAIVILCDLLWNKKPTILPQPATVADITYLYPLGFFNSIVARQVVDGFMKTGIHPYSHVYGIDSYYAEKVWGGGIRSEEWEWPLG